MTLYPRTAALFVAVALMAVACGSDSDPEAPTDSTVPATTVAEVEAEAAPEVEAETEPAAAPEEEADQAEPPADTNPNPTLGEAAEIDLNGEGVEVTIIGKIAADNEPSTETTKSCNLAGGGTASDGSSATIIIRGKDTGSVRTKVMQCKDGEWVTISDTVSVPPIVEDPEADDFQQEAPEDGVVDGGIVLEE